MKKIILLLFAILTTGLVSATEWYYPLSDYTGTGPTFIPSSGSLSFVPGVVNDSIYGWNGYNTRMIFDTGQNYTFNQFTVSFWVKNEVSGTSKNLFWMFYTPPYSLTTRLISQAYADGHVQFWWSDSAPTLDTPAGSVPIGQWTHLAYTLDGTTARLFVNGTVVASAPSNYTLTMNNLRVGAMGWIDGTNNEIFNMQGNMDELYIYLNEYKNETWVKAQYEVVYPCIPNWECIGYSTCLPDNTKPCNAVNDTIQCGQAYGGNYSEFTPQSCVYQQKGGGGGGGSYVEPKQNVTAVPQETKSTGNFFTDLFNALIQVIHNIRKALRLE